MRMTEEEYQALQNRRKAAPIAPRISSEPEPKRSKYGAVKTQVDGITFDSKAEARYYERLKVEVGPEYLVLRQPAFDLPGGVKYRADFLIVPASTARVVDVKGFETKEFKARKKMVEALYPIKLEVVKK